MQKLIYVKLEAPEFTDAFQPCDLLIVDEVPGASEELLGRPFVSPGGKLLREAFKAAGADFDKISTTHVVKVRPEGDRQLTEDELYSWIPSLWADIVDTCPKQIVAVGKVSHRAIRLLSDRLTNTEWHLLRHPDHVLKNRSYEDAWNRQISQIVSSLSTLKP